MGSTIFSIITTVAIAVFVFKKIKNRNRNPQNTNQVQTGASQVTNATMTETGVMEYFANTRHNERDTWFRFNYKKVGNEWRAYIIRMPSLRGRSSNAHMTHRHSDGSGNYWVCREPNPTNLRDCQNISRVWADRLLEYISTGVEANSQVW